MENNRIIKLIYSPPTEPTKVMLALSSITLFLSEYTFYHHMSLVSIFLLIYGIGLLVSMKLPRNRLQLGCYVSGLGAFAWTYEAVEEVLTYRNNSTAAVISCAFALASLWIFLRSNTRDKKREPYSPRPSLEV